MIIGIDASRALLPQRTGTEEYSYKLIKNLAGMETSGHNVLLYARKGSQPDFKLPRNFSLVEIGGDFLWTQFHLSAELLKRRIDALFVPSHSVPIIHPRNTIVTIHGLEYKNRPECYCPEERIVLDANTRISAAFAKKIIVPSQSTAEDLVKYYRINPEKIKVISHGSPNPNEHNPKENAEGFEMLFMGRIEKRKNIRMIIEAFELFMKSNKKREAKLVLAGKEGFGFEEIKNAVLKSPYCGSIYLPGYVSETEKKKLYKNADIFLFPSLAEGFGLPILEAMSYGIPVITSEFGAVAETAGRGAVLINSSNAKSLAGAMKTLYTNREKRTELRKRGYENLKRFSWQKCAQETWEYLMQERR